MSESAADWFAARTSGAPDALQQRAQQYFDATAEADVAARLAAAGDAALSEAVRGDRARSAALDLLAADALITLALLATAERKPEQLGRVAADLRRVAGDAS